MENTPGGRVVSWLSLRDEEQMKMEMREEMREKWNWRDNPGCQDVQKHLKEGRRDCCNKDSREEGSGMRKQGSRQRRLFKIHQRSETIKHTIIKRLNGV